MDRDTFLKVYWRQYKLLEHELIKTDDYVWIDKDNYDTFSNQYMKLLLTICSEMDSIAEVLCSNRKGDKVPYGIKNKLDRLIMEYPNLKKYRVDTKYPYDIKNITPMEKFSDSISDWWQAYNDIKHRRMEINDVGRYNYTKANLKNVLFAMAALYILEYILYESLEDIDRISRDVLKSDLFDEELKL